MPCAKHQFKKLGLNREHNLIRSTLKVSEKHNMLDTNTGRRLMHLGYISPRSGKITAKGRKALKYI